MTNLIVKKLNRYPLVNPTIARWFRPTEKVDSLTDVSPEMLREMGVKAIALDADNTSSYDRTKIPVPGAVEWIEKMKSEGFKLVLLSNGKGERTAYLSGLYGIPVLYLSCKPLPIGYIRAVVKLRTLPKHFVMIGDQLFTDIWGANLTGFKSVYCKPAGPDNEQKVFFAIKRVIEKITFWYLDKLKEEGI